MSATTVQEILVRKSIVVEAPQAHVFRTFTERIDTWWPRSHHIGKCERFQAIIEPKRGGRWFERGEDGSECQWGKVLAWEPPRRLLLGWQIDARFHFDPAVLTEIELRFTPDGSGTRVELEHRDLERLGEEAERMAQSFSGGWGVLLESFVKTAA